MRVLDCDMGGIVSRGAASAFVAGGDMTGVLQFTLSQAVSDEGTDSESDDEDFALTFSARSCKVVVEVSAPADHKVKRGFWDKFWQSIQDNACVA